MNPMPDFESEAGELLSDLGLPRRLLRHLIFDHGVGPGSRVLEVGCGSGAFVRFLERLGITAAGVDDSEADIHAAQAASPHLEFHCRPTDNPPSFDEHRFDLVLVRDSAAHAESLTSAAAFRATAELLACLRPGASLVFLLRCGAARSVKEPEHDSSCYRQHLAVFPGVVHDCEFPESPRPAANLRRMLRRPALAGHFTATLTLSTEPITRADWLRIADRAARAACEPCCGAAIPMAERPRRRSAA